MSQLRDYQQAAVDAVWGYFVKADGNPLVAMPGGTGKSHVIAGFLRSVFMAYPGTRAMMLTHVKKLIEQNFAKLLDHWPTAPAGIYSAGLKRREVHNQITFAGIASVAKRADEFDVPDLILVDEAHLISPEVTTLYRKFIGTMLKRNPALKVIGFSATIYRMGLGSLTRGGIFTDVAFDMTTLDAFNWLIKQGHLAPLHAIRTGYRVDVSGVPLIGGEYVLRALQEAVDHDDITYAAMSEFARVGIEQGRRSWLVFASGVEHADHIAALLNSWGIPTVAIHSKLDSATHDANFKAIHDGKVRCAVNMNELTTGVDIPEIDLIGIMRPTKSTPMWVQMLSRGTRPAPWSGKTDCLVLDFTNNTRDLGPINDPVLPKPKGEKGGGTAPVRECPECASWVHARIGVCPYCGHEFASPAHLAMNSSGLEVLKLDSPLVEDIGVDAVTYNIHRRRGRPEALLVSYHCEGRDGGNIPRLFRDYVCLEHEGPARNFAHRWWRDRCLDIDPPTTAQRAHDLAHALRIPKRILVWTNKPRPEIIQYVY